MRRVALIVTVALLAVASTAPAASADRFSGYVAGGVTGAGHHFVVGDGLFLVFVDARQSSTPYRVCWHQLHRSRHRCWSGVTGAAGSKDRIFTAAPGGVGTYLVKWTVRHHRKATWSFTNGVGD
jgi:hypothetical protein